jgi:hypothetical protein
VLVEHVTTLGGTAGCTLPVLPHDPAIDDAAGRDTAVAGRQQARRIAQGRPAVRNRGARRCAARVSACHDGGWTGFEEPSEVCRTGRRFNRGSHEHDCPFHQHHDRKGCWLHVDPRTRLVTLRCFGALCKGHTHPLVRLPAHIALPDPPARTPRGRIRAATGRVCGRGGGNVGRGPDGDREPLLHALQGHAHVDADDVARLRCVTHTSPHVL